MLEQANQAKTPEARADFLSLAASWQGMADMLGRETTSEPPSLLRTESPKH
jgi:hypothetical protein